MTITLNIGLPVNIPKNPANSFRLDVESMCGDADYTNYNFKYFAANEDGSAPEELLEVLHSFEEWFSLDHNTQCHTYKSLPDNLNAFAGYDHTYDQPAAPQNIRVTFFDAAGIEHSVSFEGISKISSFYFGTKE